MKRRIHLLAALVLIGFGGVTLALAYWAGLGRDSLLGRPDNLRRAEDARAVIRGTIFDRDGVILAQPTEGRLLPSGKPAQNRRYPMSVMAAVTGYYSLLRGASGAEAAFEPLLSGANLPANPIDRLLNRPRRGQDVRLTVDSGLQAAIAAEMGGRAGAVVVMEVPSGAVRALYSAPVYDPNTIERDFTALRATPLPRPDGRPSNPYSSSLYNRAVEVPYPPGGILQTVIWAAILAHSPAPAEPLIGATNHVTVNGVDLGCLDVVGEVTTFRAAFAFACPYPFGTFAQSNQAAVLEKAMALGLGLTAPLIGYPTGFRPDAGLAPDLNLTAFGAGQAGIVTTPLHMVRVAATIANGGTTITPYMLDAVQGDSGWETPPPPEPGSPALTAEAAATLADGMINAVQMGAARAANVSGLPAGTIIAGHAATAIGPDAPLGWFIGFVRPASGTAYAVAVVVEGVTPAEAARIGGAALRAALQS